MIYIDDMKHPYKMTRWPFRKMLMSHMFCDPVENVEELHLMADAVGVSRQWFQWKKDEFPHYDISQSMKKKAIKLGAIEVTMREMVKMVRDRRLHDLADPVTDEYFEIDNIRSA